MLPDKLDSISYVIEIINKPIIGMCEKARRLERAHGHTAKKNNVMIIQNKFILSN
ncbi:hypothetical protein [Rachiplusia nu nucleopolyhedrovirus]|uniref:Uncharacterized protein n=1 Tax=Rachiplusia nu nucleopolyhedrovirus TaxID=2605775 RepID=A0AAE6IQT9_9ABAC|nr:hypothetical protein QKQ55_gp125 [Rachiplusia nu nucleopolyhedrovirus]QEI03703.1 hypothetical protein [Rachiplusia nu nucleopolyhedrovirus]